MKDYIVVDFNGALLSSRPFSETHKQWFFTMSVLLNDESINNFVGSDNYFEKVHEVMRRYLGEVDEQTRINFARSLFSMTLISQVKEDDLAKGFVDFLFKIKNKYKLALVTSAPSTCVVPILRKLKLNDLFDIIIKSKDDEHPNKQKLLKKFLDEHEKCIYIGLGDKDLLFCKNSGIRTISVNWVSQSEHKGEFDVNTVDELDKIL
jgi:phosphoglycolate phosphatase-like HAD superfamily hydrolase